MKRRDFGDSAVQPCGNVRISDDVGARAAEEGREISNKPRQRAKEAVATREELLAFLARLESATAVNSVTTLTIET